MRKTEKRNTLGKSVQRSIGWILSKLNPKVDEQKTRKREKRWVELNSVGIFGGHR